jgi:hypothetical protein
METRFTVITAGGNEITFRGPEALLVASVMTQLSQGVAPEQLALPAGNRVEME